MNARILIVDDESTITGAMELILRDRGYITRSARNAAEALELIRSHTFDLVYTDLKLPDLDGIELLASIKQEYPETQVILMTAHHSLHATIEAIKKGAFYYIEKPFTPEQVVMLSERALESAAIRHENRMLKHALAKDAEVFGIIGCNVRMRQIYETIRTTAGSDASVLIEGESGTGKELIARAFHQQGSRPDRTFVGINCAAIPRDLIESELFGYKRGAFTGADRDKRGLIETASGGTLFLDEIAETPAPLQAKLLRVLQQRKLRRIGEEREIDVDFRLISATNQNTADAIRNGSLRNDLYYRISTIRIQVPPLRERLDDLTLIAEHFLGRYSAKYGRRITGISAEAVAVLVRYSWPGNVRELESVIEHAVLFCHQDRIHPDHLPEHIGRPCSPAARCTILPYTTLQEIEREAIEQTLARTQGNIKKAAEILHLHRPTLYRKLKSYGYPVRDASRKS